MAIVDTKKDLKLGQSVVEAVQNADDNFTTLFDNQDDLQTQINGKEDAITKKTAFNKDFATTTPVMDGTASAGSADTVARGDHKHPTDTTRQAASPDGTNPLIKDGKINTKYIPDSVLGQLEYKGTWDASTGTSGLTPEKGHYYICSKAGSKYPNASASSVSFAVGDWVVYNGTSWDKVDNTDAVTMVNGQIGSVKTYKGEYSELATYYPGDIVLGSDDCLYLFVYAEPYAGAALGADGYWQIFGKVYTKATTTADGLMSKEDKAAVDINTAARHTHKNKALLDTYDQTNVNIKDAVDKRHTHTNKAILDATTASYTEAEKTKLSKIDDSLLDKTFDEFGKVKDVTLDGASVVDTNGVAVLKSAYNVSLEGTSGKITQTQYNALLADNKSYIDLRPLTSSTQHITLHRASYSTGLNATMEYSGIDGNNKTYSLFISSSYEWSVATVVHENAGNKINTITDDGANTRSYPTTEAVKKYVGTKVTITDIKKPGENGASIVNSTTKIATLPNVNLGVGTSAYDPTSSAWVTKTINGKTYYGVLVPAGFKAMLNVNGQELLCQLVYDSVNKKFTACIAEKQAVTIISETPAYA